MEFVFGFCGAAVCVLTFGGGAVAGWLACRATHPAGETRAGLHPADAGEKDDPEERRLEDECAAFFRLQTYGAEDAYGLRDNGRDDA